MAQLVYKQIGDGGALALDPVNASDTVPYDDRGFLMVNNAGAGPVDVTVVIPGAIHGNPLPDLVVSVPAGGWRMIKFAMDMVDTSTGLITINYSATTSVTAAAMRV